MKKGGAPSYGNPPKIAEIGKLTLEDLHAGLIRSTILGTIAIRSNLVHPKLFRQKVLAWNFFTNRPPVIACVVRTGIKPPVAVDSFQYIFRPLNVYARKAGVA
jgi:hypothetical protein